MGSQLKSFTFFPSSFLSNWTEQKPTLPPNPTESYFYPFNRLGGRLKRVFPPLFLVSLLLRSSGGWGGTVVAAATEKEEEEKEGTRLEFEGIALLQGGKGEKEEEKGEAIVLRTNSGGKNAASLSPIGEKDYLVIILLGKAFYTCKQRT